MVWWTFIATVTKGSALASDHLWWVAIATPSTPGSIPAVRSCDKTHVHDINQQVLSPCVQCGVDQ